MARVYGNCTTALLTRSRANAIKCFDEKRVVDGFVGVSANSARNCATLADMLKRETFPAANIYVPTARRKTLDLKRVDAIAHSMLTEGQQTPILVRADGARFVLVERACTGSRPQGAGRGYHRRLPRRRPEALGDVVKEPLRHEMPKKGH